LHYGGYSDSPNLDFNVILQGDLNFWMLDNTQGVHSDEGCFLFTQSHFSENIPKLVKTQKVLKSQTDEFTSEELQCNRERNSSWTDRISFHNPFVSNSCKTVIVQEQYITLFSLAGPSDHLPVNSTFNIKQKQTLI